MILARLVLMFAQAVAGGIVMTGSSGGASLQSIQVNPGIATIAITGTQQFAAAGTFSDGSILPVCTSSGWASSNTGVATINSTGLATGVAQGSTNITCTVGILQSPAAVLNVTNTAVFTITTTTLPTGSTSAPYTPTVATINGTNPCTGVWTGSIPGVTLPTSAANCQFALSGTPSTPGTYPLSFTATDSAAHVAGPINYSVQIFNLPCTPGPPNYLCTQAGNVAVLGNNPGSVTIGTLNPNAAYVFQKSDLPGATRYDTLLNPVGTNCITDLSDDTTFGGFPTGLTYNGGSGGQQGSLLNDFIIVATNGSGKLMKINPNDASGCMKLVYPLAGQKVTSHVTPQSVFSNVTDNLIYSLVGATVQHETICGTACDPSHADPTFVSAATTDFDFTQCPHTPGVGASFSSHTGYNMGGTGADTYFQAGYSWPQFGDLSGQGSAHNFYVFNKATGKCATLNLAYTVDGITYFIAIYDWCDPNANGHGGDHANCINNAPVATFPQCANYAPFVKNAGFHGLNMDPAGLQAQGGYECPTQGRSSTQVKWAYGTGPSVAQNVATCNTNACSGHGEAGNTGVNDAANPNIGYTPYSTYPSGNVSIAGPFAGFGTCEMHSSWPNPTGDDTTDAMWTFSICDQTGTGTGTCTAGGTIGPTGLGLNLNQPFYNEIDAVKVCASTSGGVCTPADHATIPRVVHNFVTGPPSALPCQTPGSSNFVATYGQQFPSQDGNWLFFASPMLGNLGNTKADGSGNQVGRIFAVHVQ